MFRLKIGPMSSSLVLLQLALVFFLQVEAAIVQPTSVTAVFNMNGVTGWVRFFQDDPPADILVNLQGLTQDADWSIHELPVDETLSPSDRCSENYLGIVFNPNDAPALSNPDCDTDRCPVGDLSLK